MVAEIGFIGVGIMGRHMAANLAKAGRTVIAWNRSREAVDALAATFPTSVTVAERPGDVIARCAVTYCMLSTPEASEAVFPDVLAAVTSDKAIVDCATLTVERMVMMAAAVRARGGLFLEAPVAGSKGPAEAGQLVFMTAGDERLSQLATDDLSVMGKRTFYFGEEVGLATKFKLVNNMIMAAQTAALAEGVALCEGIGIDPAHLLSVLELGAMNSPLVKSKGQSMISRDFEAHFPLKHAQKDLRFALCLGDQHGISLPVSAATNEEFKRVRNDHGDSDMCAVIHALRRDPN